MKRLSLSLLITFFCSVLMSQQKLSFSVLEFEQDVFDTSAKSAEYGRKDGNGSWYAIIKVTSNSLEDDITACQFNFGNMSSKVEKHDEAIWVYVQRNAKKVTISRPGYHTINQYDLQTTIEAGCVYKMKLTSDRIEQRVVQEVKLQMVKFQTSPVVSGAIVMATNQITGEKVSVGITSSNGAVSKAMSYGKYSYEVIAPDNLYYPSEGIITLNNNKTVLTENVILRPHFAEIALTVAGDADIYINNEHRGKGSWKGKLSPGQYYVICKKEKHRDTQQNIIAEEGKSQNITLRSPEPITGTVVLNTAPTDANIVIDNKSYGTTPQIINDILIGTHEVILSLKGYRTEKRTIVVTEGKTIEIDVQMLVGTNRASKDMLFSVSGSENGHDYVDLGLPSGTLWATCNVGAEIPSDYGNYYAWGETSTKTSYSEFNYVYRGDKKTLPSDKDAACVNWGGNWRMPTNKEFRELYDECAWTWTYLGGKQGYEVTSKKNGNSIFLPAAGYYSSSPNYSNAFGYYWSSPFASRPTTWTSYRISHPTKGYERYLGRSVRPVFSR